MAAVFLPRALSADPSQPSMSFPVEPQARLAVTSYPFRAYIESPTNRGRNAALPGMDLKAFPAFVAEHFGVYNVNPLLDHFGSTDPAYLESFRVALAKAGSHIVDLGLGGAQFYSADSTVRQAAVERGRKSIDIAVSVGSPSVRQHVSGRETPDVSLAADSLGRLAEYGEKREIVVNLENDAPVPEDPFFLTAVIDKVKSPYLRALPDFGNSLIGHDADYNYRAVKAMLMHAFNMCHVKDVVVDDTGKRSRVDLESLFKLAKSSGFRGFFSMEYETDLGDPIAGTKELVRESLQFLA
jgi:sugar phosphate isomerase/epimerase